MKEPAELLAERVITLRQACDMLPGNPAFSTVYRWATRGLRHRNSDVRLKLETVCIGKQRLTSVQAVTRFLNLLSE